MIVIADLLLAQRALAQPGAMEARQVTILIPAGPQ
jgi:hypothetical protein